jgi:hypothetical protein
MYLNTEFPLSSSSQPQLKNRGVFDEPKVRGDEGFLYLKEALPQGTISHVVNHLSLYRAISLKHLLQTTSRGVKKVYFGVKTHALQVAIIHIKNLCLLYPSALYLVQQQNSNWWTTVHYFIPNFFSGCNSNVTQQERFKATISPVAMRIGYSYGSNALYRHCFPVEMLFYYHFTCPTIKDLNLTRNIKQLIA